MAGQFLQFFGKNGNYMTFRMFLEQFKRNKLLGFGSHMKEFNCSVSSRPPPLHDPHLLVKFKTHLKACILFGINSLSDLCKQRTSAITSSTCTTIKVNFVSA